jgi:hypothetical protein
MAQAARRTAWPSSEVEQAERQARGWADRLVEGHERISGRLGEWSRAAGRWPTCEGC